MNIFEELRADHDAQRSLMERLLSTSGDSLARRALWPEMVALLESHAASEERCFYAPLFQHDMTVEKARHSVAEHHELDELIARIQDCAMDSPGWLQITQQLAERLEHHLEEEEQEVFQLAGRVLTEQQKSSLGADYREEMGPAGLSA